MSPNKNEVEYLASNDTIILPEKSKEFVAQPDVFGHGLKSTRQISKFSMCNLALKKLLMLKLYFSPKFGQIDSDECWSSDWSEDEDAGPFENPVPELCRKIGLFKNNYYFS